MMGAKAVLVFAPRASAGLVAASALALEEYGFEARVLEERAVLASVAERPHGAESSATPAAEAECCIALLEQVQATSDVLHHLHTPSSALQAAPSSPLLAQLQQAGLLTAVAPLHDRHLLARLASKCRSHLLLPAGAFRSYFGDQVGFYAAFLNSLQLWLLPLALVAATLQVAMWRRGENEADSPLVPLYAAFTVLWAGAGLKTWRRHSAALAVLKWGLPAEPEAAAAVRPEFRGYTRRNPITGEAEMYYPWLRRLARLAVSATASLGLVGGAGALLLGLLNLQGIILPAHAALFMPRLAALSAPGGVFAPGRLLAHVPMALRVIATSLYVKHIYKPAVAALVRFENQHTRQEHEDSLLLKRALLQALLDYVPMIYIGLGTGNALAARRELAGLYATEAARRVATEVVLPLLSYLAAARQLPTLREAQRRAKQESGEKPDDVAMQALSDAAKARWDLFEDMAELARDMGYIVMFAAAFPAAALISCGHTALKLRTDGFKLLRLYQRPTPAPALGLGRWMTVLTVQVFLAALTNTLLSGLSAAQLAPLLPSGSLRLRAAAAAADAVKQGVQDAGQVPAMRALPAAPLDATTSASHVLVLFALEHALLLGLLAIQLLVPNAPEAVRLAAAAARRRHDGVEGVPRAPSGAYSPRYSPRAARVLSDSFKAALRAGGGGGGGSSRRGSDDAASDTDQNPVIGVSLSARQRRTG